MSGGGATLLIALPAAVLSLALLGLLAWRDPKRLRVLARLHGRSRPAWPLAIRRTLGLGSLLPGLGLMLSGHWAAWLIWMSSVAAGGWTLSLRLAPRSAHELSGPDQQ